MTATYIPAPSPLALQPGGGEAPRVDLAQKPLHHSRAGAATAADLPRPPLMAVDQYDHVAAAAYLMKHAGTTALAVLDAQRSNEPIGCITETDIAEAMAHGKDMNQTRIRDLIADGHAPYAMDPEGRPCQSPVATPQTNQAGAAVTVATDATGALETVPECPAFPHLPADIQHALADFDARVAEGRLPMDGDGHPAIPAAAGVWISDFLDSRIPSEI